MTRAHFGFLPAVIVGVTGLAVAQSQLRFEVASIKQNTSDARSRMGTQPGGRVTVTNTPVRNLIAAAFSMFSAPAMIHARVVGGPDWIDAERYDINAKASSEFQFAPDGPPKDMLLMLRSLLEERFRLKTHYETRELPIYELVVARADRKLGPELHKSNVDCEAVFAARRAGVPPIDPNGPGLFTALEEQLGLKLAPAKGPVEVLVIDSIEHPTPD
jgi:hypothetical protein